MPKEKKHGEVKYKVQRNWLQRVTGRLRGLIEEGVVVEEEIYNDICSYLIQVYDASTESGNRIRNMSEKEREEIAVKNEGPLILTTRKEIDEANEILKKVILYLENKLKAI